MYVLRTEYIPHYTKDASLHIRGVPDAALSGRMALVNSPGLDTY